VAPQLVLLRCIDIAARSVLAVRFIHSRPALLAARPRCLFQLLLRRVLLARGDATIGFCPCRRFRLRCSRGAALQARTLFRYELHV